MNLVTDRPLRKDAERNRQLILDAARQLFAQRGLSVSLNDIAHHAGVGVGTVYRRFPDKEVLIESLLEQKVDQMVALAEEAVGDPDPWRGLERFFEGSLEMQARDLALKDLVLGGPDALGRVSRIRARMLPLGERLLKRAKDAGALRADLDPSDMPMIQVMLGALIDGTRDVDLDLWRRFLPIVLQGLRSVPEPAAPLPHPPLPAQDVDAVLAASKFHRR